MVPFVASQIWTKKNPVLLLTGLSGTSRYERVVYQWEGASSWEASLEVLVYVVLAGPANVLSTQFASRLPVQRPVEALLNIPAPHIAPV